MPTRRRTLESRVGQCSDVQVTKSDSEEYKQFYQKSNTRRQTTNAVHTVWHVGEYTSSEGAGIGQFEVGGGGGSARKLPFAHTLLIADRANGPPPAHHRMQARYRTR